jgi:hypothetical protein
VKRKAPAKKARRKAIAAVAPVAESPAPSPEVSDLMEDAA